MTTGAAAMREFKEILKWCEQAHEWAENDLGVPLKTVLARFVVPFEQGMERMKHGEAVGSFTLEEVMTETGWSRKYFDKKLVSLGNRSRLDALKAKGLARIAAPGIWLIEPAGVPSRKPGYTPLGAAEEEAFEGQDEMRNGNDPRPIPDAQAFADRFTEEE